MSTLPQHGARPSNPPAGSLAMRLEEYTDLSDGALAVLRTLDGRPTRKVEGKRDLIRQGQKPDSIYLVKQGWACRYKLLRDGRRQIVDFLIPGDLCELNVYILSQMDHSIGAITPLEVVEIGTGDFQSIIEREPEILRALWWQELVSKSCHREWIVNVAVRTATERVAHLFCEMFLRLESIGATTGYSCDFPLTQVDIADACGLTSVHVNRTLQRLRHAGLISLRDRTLTIPDMDGLKAAASFNPDYLHLRRMHRHPNAKGPAAVAL
jgi:CRP-like cAMP-binding protein